MNRIIQPEKIMNIQKASTTSVYLPSGSIININGWQYTNIPSLTCNIANSGFGGLDSGLITINKLYKIFIVLNSNVFGLVASLNDSPLGFANYKFIGYLDTNNSNQIQSASKTSNGSVGLQVFSALSETDFQLEYGVGWVLYDNRNITGSKLHTLYGLTTLHDARGLFLRATGLNTRLNAFGNNYDGSTVGAYMSDNFQQHQHKQGGVAFHSGHGYQGWGSYSVNPTGLYGVDVSNNAEGAGAEVSGYSSDPVDFLGEEDTLLTETKPASLAMNLFIKIN